MSSPTEAAAATTMADKIPSDFTHCVQKLLSSVSTLSKHLALLTAQKETKEQNEELTRKLQAIKDAINSLAPAVHTAQQLDSTSPLVERLSTEYSRLCNDYKNHYSLTMADTLSFAEYKQYIEHLSSWLSSTNANIHEVLQTVNKQRALLIIKNLDELTRYKSLLERATILNRAMAADLPDEQAKEMNNEIADVKEQWRVLIEGLNTLKERHASRYTSPERTREEDRLAQQNENLVHYIESWFTLARELIREHEQSMMVDQQMIDEKKIVHGSLITSDNNNSTNPNLLCQFKECERELIRLKTLLDENCRILKNKTNQIGEVTQSLADELNEIAKSVTTARIQLENRIEQQRGFLVELDSLIDWLNHFLNQSNKIDHQTIQLALNERQQHFDELIKYSQSNDHSVKDKVEKLIQMWNHLRSLSNN